MKGVSFEVVEIKKANKEEYFVVDVKFNNSEKIYNYVRKSYEKEGCHTILIDGCLIFFNDLLEVVKIERVYETSGWKRRKKKSETAEEKSSVKEKIKNEIKEKGIEVKEENKEEEKAEVEENKDTEDKPVKKVKQWRKKKNIKHEKYEDIKTCIECNIPVYLVGPAGSGKNFTLEQIAKEMDMDFYFSNSVQQEFKLTGFIDAGGKYHETEFYKACTNEKECIFFLDEMDASIPEVLVLLNAAIANGYFEFPNGKVNIENVHFVAAGNTFGNGADEQYTGRLVLDQATLDRFAVIEFDYDKEIEMNLTNGNEELVDFVRELRNKSQAMGIRTTFSYRCLMMVTKLEGKMDIEKVLKMSVFKGMDKDTLNTIRVYGETKYHKALANMAA